MEVQFKLHGDNGKFHIQQHHDEAGRSKTVAASQTANGNVTQQSGTPLIINSGVQWQIKGRIIIQDVLTNNGIF